MFMGQMLKALRANTRFSMTSGAQLREYHHVDDEAKVIIALGSKFDHGCFDISHGYNISLYDLAHSIFEHFNKIDLLGVGDIESPSIEAFEPIFKPQTYIQNHNFRKTLPAIKQWLEIYI